jgi:LysM repeat protein
LVGRDDWRRYAAPAAFLLAVTVAVVLIRAGMNSGSGSPGTTTLAQTSTHKTVAVATTTTIAKKTTAKRYWTVQAGDTFGSIASQSGVPVATIEQLNPTVKSTSLFIGEKLRLR